MLGSESVYVVLIVDFLFSEFIVVFLYAFIQEKCKAFHDWVCKSVCNTICIHYQNEKTFYVDYKGFFKILSEI